MKIGYFTVGTNDRDASTKFYDSLFEQAGPKRIAETDRLTYWQNEEFAFATALPIDGKPATNGNGTMVGFGVSSADEVKRLHKLAIELGGNDEGEPNQRGPYFSAYVRDLDKNKLIFFTEAFS
ncbi:VOC family protein [Pseudovibrio sp. JE062]|uniref:VOC family protein n=1 Tax=Pseudovibrio sp. JE062 TaxID=439495 RepID=UPI000186C779|nr:VOC family protein [Pseudovibrio sp. JE062]EEA94859.1 glyoxalase/bleomycin resistance protein/dioxygenase [Pseudovibrio sp. JE062]